MTRRIADIAKHITHCQYCEHQFDFDDPTSFGRFKTRDHFIPLSKNGVDSKKNIYVVCQYCNQLKADFLPEEFIYWLGCRNRWKEYPIVSGVEYTSEMLLTVQKNVNGFYNHANPPLKITAKKKRIKKVKQIKEVVPKRRVPDYCGYLAESAISYFGTKFRCVGFVVKSFGYGVKQYQDAYFSEPDQKFIFLVENSIITFDKEKVEKFISRFYPNDPIKQKEIETGKFPIRSVVKHLTPVQKMLAEPEPIFHY